MQSKVNILADDMGNVIRQSTNNSDYGYIRLQQDRVTFGNSGWVKKSNVSTLLHGKVEDLTSLDFKAEDTLPGKIVIKEQLDPFSAGDPDRDYKMAGDTGIICCVDGQPIYRKAFYVADKTAEDVLIAHDNGQAIKEANGITSNVNTMKKPTTLEAFGIDSDAEATGDIVDEVKEVAEEVVEEVVLEEESFEL